MVAADARRRRLRDGLARDAQFEVPAAGAERNPVSRPSPASAGCPRRGRGRPPRSRGRPPRNKNFAQVPALDRELPGLVSPGGRIRPPPGGPALKGPSRRLPRGRVPSRRLPRRRRYPLRFVRGDAADALVATPYASAAASAVRRGGGPKTRAPGVGAAPRAKRATLVFSSGRRRRGAVPIVLVSRYFFPCERASSLFQTNVRAPSNWTRRRSRRTDRPPPPRAQVYGNELFAPHAVSVVRGNCGFAARARFFDEKLWEEMAGAPPGATSMDDVWFSGHLARRGVKRWAVPFDGDQYRRPSGSILLVGSVMLRRTSRRTQSNSAATVLAPAERRVGPPRGSEARAPGISRRRDGRSGLILTKLDCGRRSYVASSPPQVHRGSAVPKRQDARLEPGLGRRGPAPGERGRVALFSRGLGCILGPAEPEAASSAGAPVGSR